MHDRRKLGIRASNALDDIDLVSRIEEDVWAYIDRRELPNAEGRYKAGKAFEPRIAVGSAQAVSKRSCVKKVPILSGVQLVAISNPT